MEERIDKILLERGLVSTRVRAEEIIKKYGVKVNGKLFSKPGKKVPIDAQIELLAEEIPWVSRAAFKLMDRESARNEIAKYEGSVKTDRLVKADQEIELDDIGMSDLAIDDVDLVNPNVQQECEVEDIVPTNYLCHDQ